MSNILAGLGEGFGAKPGISVINDNFHFLDPAFLFLLIPLAVLFILWLAIIVIKLTKRPERTYGSRYPLIGKGKLWGLCALPAGVLMVLAMAKPTLNQGSLKASRGDIEVVLVIDRSISMRADDVKPTRLDIAKREAFNVEPLLLEGDKAALFVFGKESRRKMYLSGRFENTFEPLTKVSFPESLWGDALIWDSDFASMLEKIYQSMDRQDAFNEGYSGKKYVPKKRTNRIVILFSDGEDQFRKDKPTTPEEIKLKGDYTKRLNGALAEFRKRGLKIYPVGVGTQNGVKWPSLLRDYKKIEDYPVYLAENWKNGISRIDKENLMFLAKSTGTQLGGNIWTVENSATTVKNYLSAAIGSNRRVMLEFSQSETDQDLWQYFLITAVGVFVLGILSYPVSGYLRRRKIK